MYVSGQSGLEYNGPDEAPSLFFFATLFYAANDSTFWTIIADLRLDFVHAVQGAGEGRSELYPDIQRASTAAEQRRMYHENRLNQRTRLQ